VQFSRRIDLLEREYKVLEYNRKAEKKELKKPEKIEPTYKLIGTDIYELKTIKSFGIFLVSGDELDSFELNNGIVPHNLRMVHKSDLEGVKLEIESVKSNYLILKSDDENRYVFYDSRISDLLFTAEDKEEIAKRTEVAHQYLGKEVAVKVDSNSYYYGDHIS